MFIDATTALSLARFLIWRKASTSACWLAILPSRTTPDSNFSSSAPVTEISLPETSA